MSLDETLDENAALIEVEPIPLDLPSVLPSRNRVKDQVRFAFSLLLGLLMHATILWLLERNPSSDVPIFEEAIPVEIVPEMPDEPQQPIQAEPVPNPEPEKPALEFFEKPATDAPRASDQDQTGTRTDVSPVEQQKENKSAQDANPEPPKEVDPWGLQGQLPQYEFEIPAPKSSIMRGNAERNYLTIVYAHIMDKVDLPEKKINVRSEAMIKFSVDSNGNIFQSAIVTSSGNREIDNAALLAVRRASPLPPPPVGGPIVLTFKLGLR